MAYVEADCTFTAQGRSFTAGGAFYDGQHIIGYLGKAGNLTNWHGETIGRYAIVSTWKTPRSCYSDRMHQVEARVDGVLYTGRSAGEGMIFKGRRKAAKARRK